MNTMHRVLISLASNHRRQQHLQQAHEALRQVLQREAYTPVVGTPAVGASANQANPYLNQLVVAYTTLPATELCQRLKQIETQLGRIPEMRQEGIVPIDLDLLLFDGQRYHERDWERPYVRQLLTQEVP